MKVTFSGNNTIKIKDKIHLYYGLIIILVILNILNSYLYLTSDNLDDFLKYLWIIILIGTLVGGIYFLLRKSIKKTYRLSEIIFVEEKDIRFGYNRIVLQLENGKSRDLLGLDNEKQLSEIKAQFEKAGFQVKV